jgi:hypothetical protein
MWAYVHTFQIYLHQTPFIPCIGTGGRSSAENDDEEEHEIKGKRFTAAELAVLLEIHHQVRACVFVID